MKKFLFFVLMCAMAQVGWGQSNFKLPFPPGTTYTCTQGNNSSTSHSGIEAYAFDFGMSIGSPVCAARAGKVVDATNYSGWNDGNCPYPNCSGCVNKVNRIVIDHLDGTYSLYLHLTNTIPFNVVNYQMVNQGDVIGYSGNSGCSTGPHLHFMVMNNYPTWYQQSIPISFSDFAPNNGVPTSGSSCTSGGLSLPLNQDFAIFGGSVSAPKNLDIYFDELSFNTNFQISNISNLKIKDGTISYTIPLSRIIGTQLVNIGSRYWRHIEIDLQASDISGLSNSYSMRNISFSLNDNGTTLKYQSNIYFTDFFNTSTTFTDVNDLNNWAEVYIRKGANYGLYRGTSLATFNPSGNLTREQAANVLVAAAIKLRLINVDISTANGTYADVSASHPSFKVIQTMRNYGFAAPNTNFNPSNAITVGEFCTFMKNVFDIQASDLAPANYLNVLNHKIVPQHPNPSLQTAMEYILKLVDIREETAGFWRAENVWDFKDFSGNNAPITQSIIVDGTATIPRSIMAKVLTNIVIWKANQTGNPLFKLLTGPAVTDMVSIGEKFDNTTAPLTSTPSAPTAINFTCTSGGSIPIFYPSDYDANSNPQHFYWSMEKNGANLSSNTTTHRSITFTAPTVTNTTTWNLYSYVANNKGKAKEYLITITVNPATPPPPIAPPTLQASNIAWTGVAPDVLSISYTRGNGQYCLVTCTEANYSSDDPIQGTIYSCSNNFTNAAVVSAGSNTKVVYCGTANNASAIYLQSNTSYRFKVYEYNIDNNGGYLYNLTNPPQGTYTTDILPTPLADFTYSNTILENTAVDFTSNSLNYSTLSWSVNNGATIQSGSTSNIAHIYFPTAGTYQVSLTVTDATTGLSDIETKNVSVFSQSQTLPDLTIQNLSISPISVLQNQSVVATCNIANLSNLVGSGSGTIQFLFSTDNIADINDSWMGSQTVYVGAGSSVALAPHTINLNNIIVSAGNYYVCVMADRDNIQNESDESNNSTCVPITVLAALPDYITTNVTTSVGTVSSGQTFSVTGTFQNIGPGFPNSVFAGIYLSSDNQLSSNDVKLSYNIFNGNNWSNSIASGTNNNVNLPLNTPNGSYYLIVAIDFDFAGHGYGYDSEYEISESNNWFATPITVSNPNQPTTSASNLSISNVTTNTMQLSWTNGNGSARMIIMNNGGESPFYSNDNISYTPNSNYASAPAITNGATTYPNSRVVYDGTNNSVTVTGLNPDESYVFNVYEYNGTGSTKDYLQATPILGVAAHTLPSTLNTNGWETKFKRSQKFDDLHFSSSQDGFAIHSGRGDIAYTTNGGNYWTLKGISGLGGNFITSRYNGANGWIAFSDGGVIAHTSNSGQTWNLQSFSPSRSYNDIMFINPSVGFIACSKEANSNVYDGAILKTTNGGNTWSLLSGFTWEAYSVYFYDNNNGWATSILASNGVITNSLILKTTDGGNTWTSVDVSLSGCYRIKDIYFTDLQTGFAVYECGQVLKTTNGGLSWVQIPINNSAGVYAKPTITFANSNTGYITWGGKYITTTSDGGNSWSDIQLIHNNSAGYFTNSLSNPSPNALYFCGSSSGVFKTSTLGQSNFITPTLSASTYCPSSPISAPYTLTGTFNAVNTFTLELSDANGSFQNPVTLASASSTSAGTLSGILPANIAQGTGYKIRITATAPVTIGAESSIFTVNSGFAAQITNIPTNLTTVSSPITMSGTPSGGTFTINGTTATQFNAATLGAGTHTVVYSVSQGGCAASITQYVSVSAATLLTASTSTTSVCAGSSVNVNYNAQGNYDPSNYFTVELSDELGSFANPTVISSFGSIGTGTLACTLPQNLIQGNSYRVRVVSSLPANVGTASNIFAVQAAPLSSVAVNVIPGNVICGGNNVTFQATPTNGGTSPVYQWKLNGTNVGANLYQYSNANLQDGDVVWVEMTSNAVCASTTPAVSMVTNMNVTVVEMPTIESLDNIMASSSFAGNQWLMNGQPIQGATGQFYEATQTGFYQVQVTINGCTATSASFPFTYVGIETPYSTTQGVKLYPNPTEGNFTIEWEKSLSNATNVEVINNLGQVVHSQSAEAGKQELIINLQNVAKGMYMVKIGHDMIKLIVD